MPVGLRYVQGAFAGAEAALQAFSLLDAGGFFKMRRHHAALDQKYFKANTLPMRPVHTLASQVSMLQCREGCRRLWYCRQTLKNVEGGKRVLQIV